MKKGNKTSYCALLLAGILTTGAAIAAVGTAQARYTTVTGWQMTLEDEPRSQVSLVSDVMAQGGQTVVLGAMSVNDTRQITASLEVEGGTAQGELYFSENPYLTGTCLNTIDGASQDFDVLLTPTEAAAGLTVQTTTVIRMFWNEDLWADLELTLLPDQSETEENGETVQIETVQETTAENFLSGMTEFDPSGYLALQIAVPAGCDRILLGDETLPRFLRYSLNGGTTFFMLYDGGAIELFPGGAESLTVLLDFEAAALTDQALSLTAKAYSGTTLLGTAAMTTQPSASVPRLEQNGAVIVTADAPLQLTLPLNIGGAELYYSLDRLNENTADYPTIAVEDGKFTVKAVSGDAKALAGTYLLNLTWNYQDVTVATRQLTFYINYSAYVSQSGTDTATEATSATEETTEPATTGG